MDKLLQYINNKTNNSFTDIKLSNVIYDRENAHITFKFVYKKERNTLTEKERDILQQLSAEFLNENVSVEVKTKKALIDEDVVKDLVFKFVQSNYSSLGTGFTKNNINVVLNGASVGLELSFLETYVGFLKKKNFAQELTEFLQQNFFEDFEISFKEINEGFGTALDTHREKVEEKLYVPQEKAQFLDLENVEAIVGEAVLEQPLSPQSIKNPVSSVAVAGNLRFLSKRSFRSRHKNAEGEYVMKDYFNFNLSYDNVNLPCVIFPSATDIEKIEKLAEGTGLVVFGDAETFNEKINFKVKRISTAQIKDAPLEEAVELKSENENYIFVVPEPYVMMEQVNLFDTGNKINAFLENNEIVVFDFETTGLEATTNEIIEIGAVKIHKGKITETFSTFVKPKAEISEEITGITGITNEMVKDAYSIEQVLPDFYKFTKNCVLSAYNIAFDYAFLYAAAKKQGYLFDNRQIDTMYLAKTKVHGVKNYKLKSVASHLGITLDNAHRAIYDTIATAEIFILLSDDLQ